MSHGHIDQAVDSLLWAVAELHEVQIPDADSHIDAAIARVRAASDTVLASYVGMLVELKTDVAAIRGRIQRAVMDVEDLAARIDNAI